MGEVVNSWIARNASNAINVFKSEEVIELTAGSNWEFLLKSSFYLVSLALLRALLWNKVLLPFYVIITFMFFLSLLFLTEVVINLFSTLSKRHSVFGVGLSIAFLVGLTYLLA